MQICIDCRFCDKYNEECHHPSNIKENPVNGNKYFVSYCSLKNKNGNCQDFEKLKTEVVYKKYLWWHKKKEIPVNMVRQEINRF
jgi:hypothetical protein